jgi:CRISPR/Cas system-associated endonuclease/helicase Cas3
VDLSAKTLFTEIPPWASIVQRGRCNRHSLSSPERGAKHAPAD